MRRKLGHPTFSTLYYKDDILSVPGYTFEKVFPWNDTGSMTLLAEGSSLKDGSNVLAKIARANSNGSMCIDRESHILLRLANTSDGSVATLRQLDYVTIPREHGDCVVLILVHPGVNLLGRYLPQNRVNDLLLADRAHLRSALSSDVLMSCVEEAALVSEAEDDVTDGVDTLDLSSFLEFAIHSTRCLETLHKIGVIHREVRANAFHFNAHTGSVRLIHFGNRAISLENFGSPSSLVLRAAEGDKHRVKEALCYLAPEQTGSIETMTQDHRTDLYSLGVLFWTLLVGHGNMPFEGQPLELLHAIVQKRPMPVHDVRRDVPEVLASIIEKLLAKSPDARYQSAHGLQKDLLECQRRLLGTISSATTNSSQELIPRFAIAKEDRFMEFTLPIALFGRDKELETIRNVIYSVSTNFSRQFTSHKGLITSSTAQATSIDDTSETLSSSSDSPNNIVVGDALLPLSSDWQVETPASISPSTGSNTNIRKTVLRSTRTPRTQAVLLCGPPGIGKSSMILANQAKWRSHGLWGQAKFQTSDSAPFVAMLGCLSSVLRQLMVFPTDLRRFVAALQERLGPQIQNAPLLYQGTPELQDILARFDINVVEPKDTLSTRELRARFQSLVENVFCVIGETRLFALFLDDLHEADESSLDLVSTLLSSRSRMLIFATLRSTQSDVVDRVRGIVARTKLTWIDLEPLAFSAISTLVSQTLHRTTADCVPLSNFIYDKSKGNAFFARSVLTTLQRQHHIVFDWGKNCWNFDMQAIEESRKSQAALDPANIGFLTSQFRELKQEARKCLLWASFFGETFKVTEVALMMDWEDSSGSGSDDEKDDMWNVHKAVSNLDTSLSNTRASMRGLQFALQEGWLIQRARDMCSFTHDRYRQAVQSEADALSQKVIAKMSLRIILMMLTETPIDEYRVAEHAKRCLPLLQDNPNREQVLDVLIRAGESAFNRGAHELATRSFMSARALLLGDQWGLNPNRTFHLFSKLSTLFTWSGDYDISNDLLMACYAHSQDPEDIASVLRLRSRNHYLRNNFRDALQDILTALRILNVDVNPTPSEREADILFQEVKNSILAEGFDTILGLKRTTDTRWELAFSLLNDAGLNAYWMPSTSTFCDVIGLTTIKLALEHGMSPGTALGFFWALGAIAEKRELYRFSADLGKLALMIAERHGSSGEKCRAQVLFSAMVSGYDSVHIRVNIPRLEQAVKWGSGAGDRMYTSFAGIHAILTRLYVCEHLSELVVSAEECFSDVRVWGQGGDPAILAIGVLNCIRVLGGYTKAQSEQTLFDTDSFKESIFLDNTMTPSSNRLMSMSWYNAFKVVSYFCTGYVEKAANLGFSVFASRQAHPNHRHIRYALFFHSLSLIACLRKGRLNQNDRAKYLAQIGENQAYIRRWLSPSPINTSTWVALIEAEMASLTGTHDAFRLYDIAVKLAVNNDWVLEEGWALYLQGSHFVRCQVTGVGSELQRRGIARHSQWGARGIVRYLTSISGIKTQNPVKRTTFSSDVEVQTESLSVGISYSTRDSYKMDTRGDHEFTLSAEDLGSILRWSKDISSDIDLSGALTRLTEIATETSGSLNTCVVIAREGSGAEHAVATSMSPPDRCQVHINPKPIREINDPLQQAVIQHTLNAKEQVCYDDATLDSRFSTEAGQTTHRSVLCLPMFGNRGQTFGAVYVSANHPFSRNTVTVMTLLCQQASISIANALYFRSVQAGTKENLKMIASQKDALEAARKSREDALKATKIKSNFLASMSHELRTPFSSFYGLLDLLSGTELNPGQSEIVQTAKGSCELLLKIIDSILDYSKLEASAVKLEPSGFLVENIIADCMELLMPMAAKKLDLSFNIEADVPFWVYADYARIRQVLMNLLGNAVKFTAKGFVRVTCSLAPEGISGEADVVLRFEIQDSGIGLTPSDVELLFVPFQQADNSSTRRFGGTGLGLSISRQLVKLMGGAIGVQSELSSGSTFWFTLPMRIYDADESRKSFREIEDFKTVLMTPRPTRILICSTSEATLAFLDTMLSGLFVQLVSSSHEAEAILEGHMSVPTPLDFCILDDQSEEHVQDLLRYLHKPNCLALRDTKIIHLYTPTTNAAGQLASSNTITPGVIKLTKPPRKVRILQTLAGLKDLPYTMTSVPTTVTSKTVEDEATAQRTLFGNVLIAEDNPIAQDLLVKQLQRCQLTVTATGNGEEALAEWEAHEPGYYSVAMFDHHMPICDGVEAAKRLRHLESKRKCQVLLPIVALSADCQDSTKQLCLSAGMNAFFSKPLKRNDLAALLSMFGQSPLS